MTLYFLHVKLIKYLVQQSIFDLNMAPVESRFWSGPFKTSSVLLFWGTFAQLKRFILVEICPALGEVTLLFEYRLMFKTDPITSLCFHYDGKEARLNIWSSGERNGWACRAETQTYHFLCLVEIYSPRPSLCFVGWLSFSFTTNPKVYFINTLFPFAPSLDKTARPNKKQLYGCLSRDIRR